MAVALLSDRPGSLLICNGYKDAAYMELVCPTNLSRTLTGLPCTWTDTRWYSGAGNLLQCQT